MHTALIFYKVEEGVGPIVLTQFLITAVMRTGKGMQYQ